MTLFEYISVAVSIVVSLGAAHLLRRLRNVFTPGRVYWLHVFWFITLLYLLSVNWWFIWGYQSLEEWNYLRFLLVLSGPAILYIQATTLVPDAAHEVSSWREHYYASRSWFFPGQALWFLQGFVEARILLQLELFHPLQLSNLAFFSLAVPLAISRNPRLHAALSVLAGVLTIPLSVSLIFDPPGPPLPRP